MFTIKKYFFRLTLEKGAILLDHEGKDLTNVLSSIVEALISIGYIDDDIGSILLRILLYRHKYVDGKTFKKLHSGSHRQKSMASIYHTDYSGVSFLLKELKVCNFTKFLLK